MSEHIVCLTCDYQGPISTFSPTMSPYSDIRCPKCGSTNNEHNSEYLDRTLKAINDFKKKGDSLE